MTALHPSDTLANLAKAFPAGVKGKLPVDSYHARPTRIVILPRGAAGYPTPYALCKRTLNKRSFYEATWLDTGNVGRFTSKRDATAFLDMHRYAVGYRRITGELPTWASEYAR
jgi:hypothetical protein